MSGCLHGHHIKQRNIKMGYMEDDDGWSWKMKPKFVLLSP